MTMNVRRLQAVLEHGNRSKFETGERQVARFEDERLASTHGQLDTQQVYVLLPLTADEIAEAVVQVDIARNASSRCCWVVLAVFPWDMIALVSEMAMSGQSIAGA